MKRKALNLRFQEKSCANCKYYRMCHQTDNPSSHSECLLIGRTLSVTGSISNDRERLCDGWKKMPKSWEYTIQDKNPHFYDKHIPISSLVKIKIRAGQQPSPAQLEHAKESHNED